MTGWIDTLVACLSAPFLNLGDPLRRVYWLYLLSALVIAGTIFVYQRRARGPGLLPSFFAFVAPRQVFGHRSARLDYWFFSLNTAISGLILAPLVAAPTVAALVAHGLGGSASAPASAGPWWSIGLTIATLLAMDLALYIGHFL